MIISFVIMGDPPTATAQEKQVRVINGKPIFYEPQKVKEAKRQLINSLMAVKERPESPLMGPIRLSVIWMFRIKGKHNDMEWKTSKPDTDNLQKLLKDCMTKTGYWGDDAQVVSEIVEKRWALCPGIAFIIETMDESTDCEGSE